MDLLDLRNIGQDAQKLLQMQDRKLTGLTIRSVEDQPFRACRPGVGDGYTFPAEKVPELCCADDRVVELIGDAVDKDEDLFPRRQR